MGEENGGEFSYRQVWRNQMGDVHPPLYYAIIHTICSLFVGKFSMWMGLCVNILIALGITCVVFKLYDCFLGDKRLSLILTAGTMFVGGAVETVLFIRMYELAALWIVLLTWLHIQGYREKQNIKFFLILFAVALLGALTHYYVIVFMFFMGIYYGGFLLVKKRWKEALGYLIIMGISGSLTYLIFPAIKYHVFDTNRGTESIANIRNFTDIGERFSVFENFLNLEMFAGTLVAFVLFIGVIAINRYVKKDSGLEKWKSGSLGMVFFSCVAYFLFVAKSASYKSERYMFPIFPIAFFMVIVFTVLLIQMREKVQWEVWLLVMMILVTGSYYNFDFALQYSEARENEQALEPYVQDICIVLYKEDYRIVPSLLELMEFDRIVFLTEEELNNLQQEELISLDETVIFIAKGYNQKKNLKVLTAANEGMDNWQKLYTTQYMSVYHVY